MTKWTKEQIEAIEKSGTNIIVSAGAGSGKTAVLSERVLHKLKNGIHIGELLILTFTRAAAEEMKDRIRKKVSNDLSLSSEADAINSAYITTFDSFALSVVKRYHYLLNIPHDIGITDDSIVKLEKKKILDATFEEFYQEPNDDFKDFIKKYCIKDDAILRNSIGELADKIEGFISKKEFLDNIKNEYFENSNIEKIIDNYEKFIANKKKFVSLELDNLSYYFDGKYMEKLSTLVLPILNTTNLEDFSHYKKVTLPRIPSGTEEEAKIKRNNFKLVLEDLLKYSEYGGREDIKSALLQTKKTILEIVKILERYYNKLQKYKNDNQIYTFQDIALLAIRILKENESARLELKNSFKEIMIDEYQDTNDIQEEFIGLIANNNVYMVGDIKQSIYRFRGSNPIIFKEKYDKFSLGEQGLKIDLTKNFRSRDEVRLDINLLFGLLMDNDLGGAEYSKSHEMIFGNETYNLEKDQNFDYHMEVLEYENDGKEFSNAEVEIFAIAKDIKNKLKNNFQVFDKSTSKLRPAKYSDFVIILDRSKYFDDYKKIFEYLDIPLTILKDGELSTSIDLVIIKNIVDLVIRIKNHDFGVEFKFAFLSIGRSFLYEYSDEYLFDVILEKRYRETTLYEDFAKIDNYNSKSTSELFEEILDITHFYEKLAKIGDIENVNVRLENLYNISNDLGKLGLTFEDFRDYLTEIIDNNYSLKYTEFNGGENSVKILTIHKSKGLEYPVCYFADLNHEFNTMDIKKRFIASNTYGIIVPLENNDLGESIVKLLYKNDYLEEEISEKIRLFYVALTRAREKIIIILPNKDTIKLEKNENGTIEYIRRLHMTKLSSFIYGIKDYAPEYFKNLDTSSLNLTKNYLNSKTIKSANFIKENTDFVVTEIEVENENIEEAHFSKSLPELINKDTKKAMEFGTMVHAFLEYTDFKSIDTTTIEDKFLQNKVTSLLKNELFQNIKDAKIYHEYEFYYQKDDTYYHGIIDLILEYDSHIDIIDYKLKNIEDNHYLEQLTGYKSYIETISDKPIKIYLYSIMDGVIKELA